MIRLLCQVLLVIFVGYGCGTKESASESVKVMSSKPRDKALGRTLLYLAPNGKVAERLNAEGADVNASDNYGVSSLHIAAKTGNVDLVEFLLAHGANVDAKDNEGRSPLDLAKAGGHTQIAGLLRKYKAQDQ